MWRAPHSAPRSGRRGVKSWRYRTSVCSPQTDCVVKNEVTELLAWRGNAPSFWSRSPGLPRRRGRGEATPLAWLSLDPRSALVLGGWLTGVQGLLQSVRSRWAGRGTRRGDELSNYTGSVALSTLSPSILCELAEVRRDPPLTPDFYSQPLTSLLPPRARDCLSTAWRRNWSRQCFWSTREVYWNNGTVYSDRFIWCLRSGEHLMKVSKCWLVMTVRTRVSSKGWGRSTLVLTGKSLEATMTVKLVLPLLLLLLSFIMAGGAVRLAGPGQARPLDFATKIHSFGRSVSRSLGLNRRGASFTLLHDTTQHTVLLCYTATPGTLCYYVTLPHLAHCVTLSHCQMYTCVLLQYTYCIVHWAHMYIWRTSTLRHIVTSPVLQHNVHCPLIPTLYIKHLYTCLLYIGLP